MAIPQFSPEDRERLRRKAAEVQERISGSPFERWKWDLTGKQAVVAPGKSIVTRLLPRWDYGLRIVRGKDGKPMVNPQYVAKAATDIYFEALAHWFDGVKGRQHEWCPRTFGRTERCPICEAADALFASPDDEDRRKGSDVRAKPEFLFNALMGPRGKRMLRDDGKLMIRALPASNVIFTEIVALLVGTTDETSPGYGDISDPQHGVDCVLTRPAAGGGGERWKLGLLPPGQETMAWTPEEASAAEGWYKALIDLPEKVQSELRTYDQLHAAYYGKDVDNGNGGNGNGTPAAVATPPEELAAPEGDPESDPMDSMDSMIDLPPGPAEPAPPPPPSPRSPARPGSRPPLRGRR